MEQKKRTNVKTILIIAGVAVVVTGAVIGGVRLFGGKEESKACEEYNHVHAKDLTLVCEAANPRAGKDGIFKVENWCEVVPDTSATCAGRLDVASLSVLNYLRTDSGRAATLYVVVNQSTKVDTTKIALIIDGKVNDFRSAGLYLLEGMTEIWLDLEGAEQSLIGLRLNMGGLCIEDNIDGTRPKPKDDGTGDPGEPHIAANDSTARGRLSLFDRGS